MKDATGELSMTAVAVVAIAAIAALFSTLIWPTIRQNILRSTYCASATDCTCPDDGGLCECLYCPNSGGGVDDLTCENQEEIKCSRDDVN